MTKHLSAVGISLGLLLAGLTAVSAADDGVADAAADEHLEAFYVSKRILEKVREKLDNKDDVDLATINLLVSDELPDDEVMVAVDLRGTDFTDVESWMRVRGAQGFSEEFVQARQRFEQLDPASQAPPMTAEEWRRDHGIVLPEPPPKEMPEEREEREDPEEAPEETPEPPPQTPDGPDPAEGGGCAEPEPADARCAAHEACSHLQVFCCPTLDSVMLDCCYGAEPLFPAAALALLNEPEPAGIPGPLPLGSLPEEETEVPVPQRPAYVHPGFSQPSVTSYSAPQAPPSAYQLSDLSQPSDTIYLSPPPAPLAYVQPAFSQLGISSHSGHSRSFAASGLEPPPSFHSEAWAASGLGMYPMFSF